MYSNFQNVHDTTITLLNFFSKTNSKRYYYFILVDLLKFFSLLRSVQAYSLQWMKAMSVNFSKESTQIHKYKNIQYYKYATMKTQAAVTNNH